MGKDVLIDMRHITKRFPGVVANDQVTFKVQAGEVHALLGENGAGKSTLMSILSGLYRPDEGEIIIRGKQVTLKSPRNAIDHGIGMIHQHFKLITPFTVAENIALGSFDQAFKLDMKKIEQKVAEFSQKFGLHVDPQAKIWQLSIGEQQRVEIIKVLYQGADILILDEPTAVLTPQEVAELFVTVRKMAAEGKAVVIITHKLHEVMNIADRITILRKGKTIRTLAKGEADTQQLTQMMLNREVTTEINRKPISKGKTVLRLDKVSALGDKGLTALDEVSLTVQEGEILGIAGVAGNGQRELTEVITGLRAVTSGKVLIDDQDMTNQSSRTIIDAGVSYVPEDRMGMGLISNMDLTNNSILKDYRRGSLGKGLFLNLKKAREMAENIVRDFDIKTPSVDTPVRLLSGGNLQKLLLAREIAENPHLIVTSYPVRGLDVGAAESIYNLLLHQREQGRAILLIAEDLDTIMQIADRVAVLFKGKVMGIKDTNQATIDDVGAMMLGESSLEGREA